MPTIHNDILSITIKELEACGVSATYIRRALSAQRTGEVYCWEHHKQGKSIYIHYHSLQPRYKVLIREVLCNGVEPDVYVLLSDQQSQEQAIARKIDLITSLVKIDIAEMQELSSTGRYTPVEAHQLARAAAWLRLYNDFDVKKARLHGFENIDTFREELLKRCIVEQKATPTPIVRFKKTFITSLVRLYKNARQYQKEGIKSLMHAGAGNVNREKADTLAHAKLVELASSPVKYSWEDVALLFNQWAVANGKDKLTVSTVKQYLNKPKIKKIWFYNRHGKLAADNELQPLINREKPSFPDALWSIDGTTMQLYYLNDDGSIKSDLYIYLVVDCFSSAIIGYSIAYAETSGMVDDALRMAVFTHGYKPYQLQYDNSSANVSHSIQQLMTNMSRVHFACQPYKGRSKYVEGVIGHLQHRVLRYAENFKGGNITSQSLNSKANPELLSKFKKDKSLLPSKIQVIEEFTAAISQWNNRGERRNQYGEFEGETKLYKYLNTANVNRSQLNYFEKKSLFFVEQKNPYTYSTNGIEITINGTTRHYIVPDPDGVGDFMFANENLMSKFTVKLDRNAPDFIALMQNGIFIDYAYEKEKLASCVADTKSGDKAKVIMLQQKQEVWGIEYATNELQKQMEILGELKATGTNGFGWSDMPKNNFNKYESDTQDKLNDVSDGLTDRQRKILNS